MGRTPAPITHTNVRDKYKHARAEYRKGQKNGSFPPALITSLEAIQEFCKTDMNPTNRTWSLEIDGILNTIYQKTGNSKKSVEDPEEEDNNAQLKKRKRYHKIPPLSNCYSTLNDVPKLSKIQRTPEQV
jgi:hypothetical protein